MTNENWMALETPNGDTLWVDISKISTVLLTLPPSIQVEGRHIVISQECVEQLVTKLVSG